MLEYPTGSVRIQYTTKFVLDSRLARPRHAGGSSRTGGAKALAKIHQNPICNRPRDGYNLAERASECLPSL